MNSKIPLSYARYLASNFFALLRSSIDDGCLRPNPKFVCAVDNMIDRCQNHVFTKADCTAVCEFLELILYAVDTDQLFVDRAPAELTQTFVDCLDIVGSTCSAATEQVSLQ